MDFFKVLALKSVFSFNIYFRVGDFDKVSFMDIFLHGCIRFYPLLKNLSWSNFFNFDEIMFQLFHFGLHFQYQAQQL